MAERVPIRRASVLQRWSRNHDQGDRTMPEGSTKKEKRQYEHIKDSYKERGVSTKEAKERAARTVNKQRGKKKD
jgi:hypothetical protein